MATLRGIRDDEIAHMGDRVPRQIAGALIGSGDSGLGNGHLSAMVSKGQVSPNLVPEDVAEQGSSALGDSIPSAECCMIHLQLLELFVDLHYKVEEWARNRGMDPDAVWHSFIQLAIARFTHWFRTAARSVIEMETSVPPLDVLMVWHSFMLRPHIYAMFCQATRSDKAGIKGVSWSTLSRSISITQGDLQVFVHDNDLVASLVMHSDLLETCSLVSPGGPESSTLIDLLSSRQAALGPDGKLETLLGVFNQLSAVGFTYKIDSVEFDLVGAVHRQADFALKMTRLGWHHSPLSDSTLQKARERYRRFFCLISVLPASENAVPTLDIDLIWHTHQLSPGGYAQWSRAMTHGRFIDHDDTITPEAASSGSKSVGVHYREQFGEVYSICLSWYCQAPRLAPQKQLSPEDVQRIGEAIRSKQLPRRKLDLAACRCHEAPIPGDEGTSSRGGNVPLAGNSVGLDHGADCGVPYTLVGGGCGGCGGCGSCGSCG
ncbi:hypothetical protein B0H63DRAFT_487198 [Podospora didyma]|uniref:Uncharacterized protein n=1 Tax=Podospora didyma TaxID=330526 RepID=A0AAE0K728_9PEZI|nr:hypothetical protein B0H63DRAFT_487198 [Podospora didyma]